MIGHCAAGYMHDWRHLESHKTHEHEPEAQAAPTGPESRFGTVTVRVFDTWYCTRCRKIETTERT
jgi:hypothetical protein